MPLEVKFLYVCERNFDELRGADNVRRFCDSCQTEVFNLDAMDERERLELFEGASRTGTVPCVSATTLTVDARQCRTKPPSNPRPTAGIPLPPDPSMLERMRKELERGQGEKKGFLSRLKFW